MGLFSSPSNYSSSSSFSGLRGPTPQSQQNYNTVAGTTANDFSSLSNFGNNFLNSSMPQLQSNGLFAQQNVGFNQLANSLFNQYSSDAASRGMMSPENTNAVVGSALTAAAPSLMSTIQGNLSLGDQLTEGRMNALQGLLSIAPWMLGSQEQSQSTGTGAGLGYSMLNELSPGIGNGIAGSMNNGILSQLGQFAASPFSLVGMGGGSAGAIGSAGATAGLDAGGSTFAGLMSDLAPLAVVGL